MKSKIITIILAILFLSVMFGSLFHMPMATHMNDDMSGCLFMVHEEGVLCPMSILDHLTIWGDNFLSIIPIFTEILLVLGITLIFLAIPPNIIISQKLLYTQQKILYLNIDYLLLFPKRFLQEFFARGILHPKLF